MLKRVIPILLVENGQLIKTVKFSSPTYIGDLLNSIKIYNELQVDELCVLDKSAKIKGIDYNLIAQFVDECFAPISYGGGITKVQDIEKILKLGVEKVILCSHIANYSLVKSAVNIYGSSTIVACIDYRNINEKKMVFNGGRNNNISVSELVFKMNQIGVGEIILQSIDGDGTYQGYDHNFIKEVISSVNNPIVIAGGCKDINDIKKAFQIEVSGAAVGSLFVYYTDARGILINYPSDDEFKQAGIKR